jgi:hypothetical protein
MAASSGTGDRHAALGVGLVALVVFALLYSLSAR